MPAIRTRGLTKRYDGGWFGADVTAVEDVDLVVEEGEVYGFLGPNGAGKSTTIDMLLDCARPTAGTAEILGHDAQAESEAVSERVGVLPEGYGLYDRLTGRRNLEFAIEWQDPADDPDALLSRVGLDPDDASRPVGDYSTGMTQRLALAMALVGDPDLLILDEPSSGLDPNGVRRLREIVRAEADAGTTVFFSSHVLGQVEAVCDRVGILDDGELVAVDTIDGLRETVGASSTLELTLAEPTPADVVTDEGVSAVETRGTRLRVTCEDSRAKARVVADVLEDGYDVVDVGSESASLEDLFAAYTDGDAPTDRGDGEAGEDEVGDGQRPAAESASAAVVVSR
jgi:ABC-2 type transport system ATP-binding protein